MNNFFDHESNLQEEIIIGYLNGVLASLGTFNDGPYTGNTFEFTKLTNGSNDPELSIMAAWPHWKPELSPIDDFFQDLDKTFDNYCRSHAWSTKERIERAANIKLDDSIIAEILEATNYNSVKWNFFEALRLLVKVNYQVYAVRMIGDGWYEGAYNDYFIDCDGVYYFLHFGESD